MKYLGLIIGAGILAIAAFAARPSAPVARERRMAPPARPTAAIENPRVVERRPVETRVADKRIEPERREESPAGPALAQSQRQMLFRFERELALTADQRRHMEAALVERAAEIEEFNKRIRGSGVFSGSMYSARVNEIQARSYDRMADVLDSAQYVRFRALLAEGRLGDAVVFSLDPGMKILD